MIDGAKAASVLIEKETSIRKYHNTGEKVPKKHLPLIAIPTTAGTGSEVTNVSVLTNRNQGIKAPIASESFYPQYAIVDPTLTWSMPADLTASAGIDVLSHAVEGYWSRLHQPICDVLAVYAATSSYKYKNGIQRSKQSGSKRENGSSISDRRTCIWSAKNNCFPRMFFSIDKFIPYSTRRGLWFDIRFLYPIKWNQRF